jgi:fatty acid desaturase
MATFPFVLEPEHVRSITAVRPRPWIYWSDLLASAAVGWGAFLISLQAPLPSLLHVGATAVAICALLRAAIFVHELAHLKRGRLPGFALAWHMLIGLPFLLPSFMYVGSHSDHHRQATFGTINDPEYVPLARWSSRRIAGLIGGTLAVPALLVLRWGVLGPLSFLIPPLRRLVLERGSSLAINLRYRRPLPRRSVAVTWGLQEVAVTGVCWTALWGVTSGRVTTWWAVQWYIVAAGIVVVNQLRTLAAHRYENDGSPLDTTAQLLDSITLTGWPFTVLAAPLGLRYHALHHAFPTIPYHSLGALHRRLLAELPPDAPYRRTLHPGICSVVGHLLGRSPRPSTAAPLSGKRASEGA